MRAARPDRAGRALRRRWGGRWSAEEVVDALFATVLLRPADPPSRDYYTRSLAVGIDLAQVVAALNQSVEAVENAWRAPLSAGLGPALGAGADQPQLYLALPPGPVPAEPDLPEWLRGASGDGVALAGFNLDQLLWTPRLVRQAASRVSGALGWSGRPLAAPGARTVAVVARPEGPADDHQCRCLASEVDLSGAWVDYSPEEEALRRGLDGTWPLQALLEAGPEDLSGPALARRAQAVLDRFDQVVVVGPDASPGPAPSGPDWLLYAAARRRGR